MNAELASHKHYIDLSVMNTHPERLRTLKLLNNFAHSTN